MIGEAVLKYAAVELIIFEDGFQVVAQGRLEVIVLELVS